VNFTVTESDQQVYCDLLTGLELVCRGPGCGPLRVLQICVAVITKNLVTYFWTIEYFCTAVSHKARQ